MKVVRRSPSSPPEANPVKEGRKKERKKRAPKVRSHHDVSQSRGGATMTGWADHATQATRPKPQSQVAQTRVSSSPDGAARTDWQAAHKQADKRTKEWGWALAQVEWRDKATGGAKVDQAV